MTYPLRTATRADFPEIARMDGLSFGHTMTAEDAADALTAIDIERFLVATDPALDGRVVGVTADYQFAVTVPGGRAVAVPGVSWVSVAVTQRRRGILRRLMDHQLASYLAEGVPFAVLTASEGGIYGRFGYGAATVARDVVLDRARTQLVAPVDATGVVVATGDQARAQLPAIHARWCARTSGAVSRSEAWWARIFLDRDSDRAGMSELRYLLHPDGYVGFRIRRDDAGRFVSIRDYAIVTDQASAAVWAVLLSFDLYTAIEIGWLAPDDPLPMLLSDPRRVQTTAVNDGMWVRLLDIEAALAARTYGVEIDTVLEVRDPLAGDGRYRLCGGPEGASCVRTDAAPSVSLDVATLGSAYLGGHRLGQLARAGRIEATTVSELARLDLAFLADRAPAHGTDF